MFCKKLHLLCAQHAFWSPLVVPEICADRASVQLTSVSYKTLRRLTGSYQSKSTVHVLNAAFLYNTKQSRALANPRHSSPAQIIFCMYFFQAVPSQILAQFPLCSTCHTITCAIMFASWSLSFSFLQGRECIRACTLHTCNVRLVYKLCALAQLVLLNAGICVFAHIRSVLEEWSIPGELSCAFGQQWQTARACWPLPAWWGGTILLPFGCAVALSLRFWWKGWNGMMTK